GGGSAWWRSLGLSIRRLHVAAVAHRGAVVEVVVEPGGGTTGAGAGVGGGVGAGDAGDRDEVVGAGPVGERGGGVRADRPGGRERLGSRGVKLPARPDPHPG